MASAHPYTLIFQTGSTKPRYSVRATLESSLLDPVMQPDGRLCVALAVLQARAIDDQGFALDSFVLDSLAAYVENQGLVRHSLESELVERRLCELPEEASGQDASTIWRHVKLVYLYLNVRKVPDVDSCRQSGWPQEEIDRLVSLSDTPGTQWSFMVGVKPDWDPESRVYTAKFRDGRFVEMSFEGDG